MEPQSFVGLNADAARLLTLLAGLLAGGVVVAIVAVVISILVAFRQWRRHRASNSLTRSPSLHWVALVVCLISLPACGSPQYLPIRILTPPVDSTGAVSVGSVKLWVRPGPEWLGVAVLNAGSTPIVIDWVHTSFTEPSGKIHSLISGSELGEIYLRIQIMYSAQRARANGNTEMFSAGQRTLVTDRPLDDVQTNREALTLVTPGSRREEIFYPKEHVRLDWEGGWRAASLFCDRVMVAEWLRGESFELVIPLLIEDRWTNVRIVGRIER